MDLETIYATLREVHAKQLEMQQDSTNLKTLVAAQHDSLVREIDDLRKSMTERFDAQSTRLDKHAGLWQTGSRWSKRMEDWSENMDRGRENLVQELADLRQRIQLLEAKANLSS